MTSLAGVKVLDFTRMHSGPFASMILGDLGATVLKIEPPSGDETRQMTRFSYGETSAFFVASNRNKRSSVVDLHDPVARASLDPLIAEADIVIDNFRPSTLSRFRLRHEDLVKVNPRIVTVTVTGYGEGSVEADSPAYDLLAQARSGMMSLTGDPDGPPMKCGAPIGDIVAGIYACTGALAALHELERTGTGQHVEVAMLDAQIAMVHYHYSYYDASGEVQPRVGSDHPNMVPYGIFRCSDGYLAIAAVPNPPKFWERLCDVLGHPEWCKDPRFDSAEARRVNKDTLKEEMNAVLAGRPRAEWFQVLNQAGVPVAPVNGLDDLAADAQVASRDMLVQLDLGADGTLRLPGNPIKMPGALPSSQWLSPPGLGSWDAAAWPPSGAERAEAAPEEEPPPEPFDQTLIERRILPTGEPQWVLRAWDCNACARVSLGSTGHCPSCGSADGHPSTLKAEGTLETWSRIIAKDRSSYIVGYALIDADGRPGSAVRVFGQLQAPGEDELTLRMPVTVEFGPGPGPDGKIQHRFVPAPGRKHR